MVKDQFKRHCKVENRNVYASCTKKLIMQSNVKQKHDKHNYLPYGRFLTLVTFSICQPTLLLFLVITGPSDYSKTPLQGKFMAQPNSVMACRTGEWGPAGIAQNVYLP